MMKRQSAQGLIHQIYLLAAVCVVIIGVITYLTQYYLSNVSVIKQTEELASDISDEVIASVREYPAGSWLLRYWYEHAGEMDVEYDVDYETGVVTKEKCALLIERHPGLSMKYADMSQIEALPAEDQKLYAEVVYS